MSNSSQVKEAADENGLERMETLNGSPPVGVFFNLHSANVVADTLRKLSPDMRIEIVSSGLNELTIEEKGKLQTLEIIFTQPNLVPELRLHQLPNLKWMHCLIAGVDLIVNAIQAEKPMPDFELTRNASYFDPQMAEYVLGMILSRERLIPLLRESQRNKHWNNGVYKEARFLSDLSLGICGFGSIGKEVAKLAKTFGMKVWAVVRSLPNEAKKSPLVDEYRLLDELGDLLSSCDYIVSVLPNTPATNGFFDGEILSHCKQKKSVFINIGRGNVVSESTLIHALNEGWISHAILDVFLQEPLPVESPLWGHPGVTITPHISGVHMIPERFVKTALDNYDRHLKGQPLLNAVNLGKGY